MSSSPAIDNPHVTDPPAPTIESIAHFSTMDSGKQSTMGEGLNRSSGERERKTGEFSSNHEEVSEIDTRVYLTGVKLHLITAAFCTTLFLTNLEIPIVTTSLISITGDLNSFRQSSWIISAVKMQDERNEIEDERALGNLTSLFVPIPCRQRKLMFTNPGRFNLEDNDQIEPKRP
ncbi:uncharacterized protein BP5553_06864 [Venustampulla echinocandica]|uniref:Uncharacterized protein n=1 Tax=Venustampulla echinocandica TaxID=2656787 RepID=A0A370TL43_9HELO|nr:uncharacterized protein BP5553_06864 [Venustampulla echinocandica]RDL36252.1 hypothetical protein BP5553_06864 [Venustampulla echinocandica]